MIGAVPPLLHMGWLGTYKEMYFIFLSTLQSFTTCKHKQIREQDHTRKRKSCQSFSRIVVQMKANASVTFFDSILMSCLCVLAARQYMIGIMMTQSVKRLGYSWLDSWRKQDTFFSSTSSRPPLQGIRAYFTRGGSRDTPGPPPLHFRDVSLD
jgi:hypothetical protein